MTGRSDITRWNRAGLRRFQYVDANAATYLEELRVRLADRFPLWQPIQRTSTEVEQYRRPRSAVPDWGWEIARSLARACHVLGEHVDAFANESYLATATQWESLRRLAALVDYHPAPPASAVTNLVLVAKPGASGTVPPGFAVSAATPGAQITFETMEELAIDTALNELRPQGFDRNPEILTGNTLELDGQVDGLALGEPVVIESETDGSAWARRVDNIVVGATTTTVQVSPDLPGGVLVRGRVVVHAKPKDRLAALRPSTTSLVIGNEVVLVRGAGGIKIGDVLTIADQLHRSYHQVTGVFDPRVTFDRAVGELRFDSASVSPVVSVDAEVKSGPAFTVAVAGDWRRLANQIVADPRAFTTTLPLRYTVSSADYTPTTPPPAVAADGGKTVLRLTPTIDGGIPNGTAAPPRLLVPATGDSPWTIDRPFVVKASDEITTTLPRTTVGGDFVVAITDSSLAWGAVSSITRDEPARQASIAPVSPWQRTSGDLLLGATTVFGHFTKQLRLASWNSNPTPISGSDIPLDLPAETASLTVGRKLVVYRSDAADRGYLTAVSAATGDTLRLRDGIPDGAGFTRENLRIAGNVALASHGERQTEKVLGSGDATLSGQRFVLAQQAVSFVPDPKQPRGVRADIDVVVDGRIWEQVGTLRDVGPADSVYAVKITEDGTLELEFGDGQTGRRLPTGSNNVRVRARVGVGLAGNLPAGTLTKITRPHPLVSAVQQPLPAVGGNDRETADSLRKTAPTTLLTLERCVSPADFASLAAAHASIWQARAFVRPSLGTRAHRVEVVVVPADGAELGELAQTLATFLQSHALPNVEVTVSRFVPLPVTLAVTVEIDLAAFEPAVVLRAVRAALYDALSLRRRQLGQPVFLGDIYAVVENVPGVSTSRCVLNDDPTANRILSLSDAVQFLDPASPQTLGLAYEAKP
jgi:predicted phage baseplate assembly protein